MTEEKRNNETRSDSMTTEAASSQLFDLKELRTELQAEQGKIQVDLIAYDPQLYNKFQTHLSKTVKRDPITKHFAVITGLSTYTPEPINLFLRGESGTGKTYNVVQALRYFPAEDVWLLGAISKTALVHDYGVLMDHNGNEIDFDQMPGKDCSPEEKRAWKEKLKSSFYLIDLRGRILVFLEAPNIEVFNYLRPILSHDVFETHYKITDKTGKGQLQTKHMVLRGWPATVFCSTQEKYVQDLATRSFTITPETSQEKYQAANILSGSKAALPFKFADDFDFMLLQGYIDYLKNYLTEKKVVVPYGSEFAKNFPCRFARSMRDFQHLLSIIKVYTLFHFAQRPVLVRKIKRRIEGKDPTVPEYVEKEEIYVMAARADYDFVLDLWREVRETTETSASMNIIKFFHEVVEDIARDTPEFSIGELTDRWNKKFPDERKSSDSIRKWVDFLCDINWVTKKPDPEDKRQNVIKIIEQNKNRNYTKTDLSAFFKLDSFKEWLKKAEPISEENRILLRISEMSQAEATLEDVFARYYTDSRRENGNSSDIVLGDSKPSLTESATQKAEQTEIVQFPNLPEVCKFCGKPITDPTHDWISEGEGDEKKDYPAHMECAREWRHLKGIEP
jgi:uncharacterized protein YdaU (DUF1376 family)